MTYVRVTDLTDYLFCPRKIYFKRVLGIEEEKREQMLRGELIHKVFDKMNEEEEYIVYEILDDLPFESILKLYENKLNEIINNIIEEYSEILKEFNLSEEEVFTELKNHTYEDIVERAKNTFHTMRALNEYGIVLWDKIEPKIKTELELFSERLRMVGRIDKVEVYKDYMIPIEIKSGNMSKVHLIQLYAYGLLLKHNFSKYKIDRGIIHYTKNKTKKEVIFTEKKEEKVYILRDKVLEIIEDQKLPEINCKLSKCQKCFFYEVCRKGLNPEKLMNNNGN